MYDDYSNLSSFIRLSLKLLWSSKTSRSTKRKKKTKNTPPPKQAKIPALNQDYIFKDECHCYNIPARGAVTLWEQFLPLTTELFYRAL